jgi:flagellar hook assembly protein FlgD
VPLASALQQNYPNPFNAQTTIAFSVAQDLAPVNLTIYNILGQKVVTLLSEQLKPGSYQITWNGRDDRGDELASGLYFCSFQTAERRHTKRMVLIR